MPNAEQLRKQFVDFSERLLEQRERCEEAVAAMQQFQVEYDTFDQWLCEVKDKQKQWTEKKAPIGVIGGELEEYYVSEHCCHVSMHVWLHVLMYSMPF